MRSVSYVELSITFSLFALLYFLSQYKQQDVASMLVIRQPRDSPQSGQRQAGSKWIVVTSIQYPTEDIKNLVAQPGWHVVVVADLKTPVDWNYTNVEFLSIEKQKVYFGEFADQLPYKSYTRKTLGYLYAFINGAEWIYDTDDDNKPFGPGLSQFDYSSPVTGLRYFSQSGSNISEKLFNPYRFYGFDKMWPRGFPLEHIESHTNGKDRMVSCRQMERSAVQQGIVKADPDVDAIYRLLHAQKEGGLDVSFNSIAPPIVLNAGTYAPWNSQNTLFHYKAFFIMYLPTTVAFRVTDIWRSFFGQKLLHLIGETVAFYPTNAIQVRNSHNYLNDFHQEIDVYEQSGKIVEYLDSWNCTHSDIVNCTLQLADGFVKNKFFGQQDRDLIELWLKQLAFFGYVFPPLSSGMGPLSLGQKFSNCRKANLDLGADKYQTCNEEQYKWATETVNGFGEILEWCEDSKGYNDTFLLPVEEFLNRVSNMSGLQQKKETVLVLLSNQEWRPSMVGILQRMYSPFFKTTIFCGTWTDPSVDPGLLPPIYPLNFVHVTQEEIRGGHSYGYCVSKIKELRLQNITGYYFVADDTIFNVWHELPVDKFMNPEKIDNELYWWRPEEILRSYDAFENHYKNDPRFGKSWQQYKEALQRTYPGKNITHHYLNEVKKTIADFVFIPTHTLEYIGNLLEVMTEAEVFVEVAYGKVMDGLDYNRGGPFNYLWWGNRIDPWSKYNSSIVGIHPIKLGGLHADLNVRSLYCSTVVKAFGQEIYGQMH